MFSFYFKMRKFPQDSVKDFRIISSEISQNRFELFHRVPLYWKSQTVDPQYGPVMDILRPGQTGATLSHSTFDIRQNRIRLATLIFDIRHATFVESRVYWTRSLFLRATFDIRQSFNRLATLFDIRHATFCFQRNVYLFHCAKFPRTMQLPKPKSHKQYRSQNLEMPGMTQFLWLHFL